MNRLMLILICCFVFTTTRAQTTGNQLFDNSLHEIKIYFQEDDFWQILTDNYEQGAWGGIPIPYLLATKIIIDGIETDSVGVRQKGFSSHFSSNDFKKSLKIDLDRFVESQTFDGLKKINLHNGVGDPSFLRDVLCYDMIRTTGIPAPRTAHTRLYLNDIYWGVYLVVEQIDKTFLSEHFSDNDGNLYKNIGWSSLHWAGNNPEPYQQDFELKTNETENDWSDFIELVDVINNSTDEAFPQSIQQVFNVPGYLRVLAIDIFNNNWDSYIEHGRNYYLYHHPDDGQFHWLPWDYNLAMGGTFNTEGSPIVADPACPFFPNYSYLISGDTVFFTDESSVETDNWLWDFGNGDFATDQHPVYIYDVEDIYEVCLTTSKTVNDSLCEKTLCKQVDLIFNVAECLTIQNGDCPYPPDDPYVQQVMQFDDFCCNTEWDGFCQQLYNEFYDGGGPGGGLIFDFSLILDNPNKVLIDRLLDVPAFRNEYLNIACEILDHNFTTERLFPVIDEKANLIRESIYTDPYYIFTLNYFEWDVGYGGIPNGAVIPQLKQFIEERITKMEEDLQDEGFDCQPATSPISWMEVVINEIVASNDSTSNITDPSGDYDDWIELYNNTNTTVDLTGFYLSDNQTQPFKWAFPLGTTIEPNGYLIVWADQDGGQQGLHASFNLNKSGEQLQLIHADGTIIDSLNYGEQITNIALARIPNGTGNFVQQESTFNGNNEVVLEVSSLEVNPILVFPNPVRAQLNIFAPAIIEGKLELKDSNGRLILEQKFKSPQSLKLEDYSSGVYFLTLQTNTIREIIKVVKL